VNGLTVRGIKISKIIVRCCDRQDKFVRRILSTDRWGTLVQDKQSDLMNENIYLLKMTSSLSNFSPKPIAVLSPFLLLNHPFPLKMSFFHRERA
jgi:hypothetical protein